MGIDFFRGPVILQPAGFRIFPEYEYPANIELIGCVLTLEEYHLISNTDELELTRRMLHVVPIPFCETGHTTPCFFCDVVPVLYWNA